MLDAPGYVGPCAVLLALGHVVASEGAHHGAGVAGVGLGAVAGDAGTGDELTLLTAHVQA